MLELFFEEAQDRIEALATKLLKIERRPDDAELLRDIFRDLHTLKGSSAMVGLSPMKGVAHAAEDLVGQLRDQVRRADGAVIDALLAALDALRDLSARARRRQPLPADFSALERRLRDPNRPALPADHAAPSAPSAHQPESQPLAAPEGARAARPTIRVDFDKLDRLMNLVGELVLERDGLRGAGSSLSELSAQLSSHRGLTRQLGEARRSVAQSGARSARLLDDLSEELGRVERVLSDITAELDESTGRLDSVSADLRESVMKLRMVPIGGALRKHQRTVRDLANATGKRATVTLEGEETELDKVLVETLEEPLLHLVRNAVDHGVETPDRRVAADKGEEATISIRAMHRGNQVVIEIGDDGKGIDPALLKQRALERGIASREELAAMGESEVLDLVFRPGFSTAEVISELSGRGVGLDVVRQTVVSRLKGSVEIESHIGRGTTFRLRLPLTLAIIQVLLARAGGELFAVPLDQVLRTIACAPEEVQWVQNREMVSVRQRHLPLIRLSDVLELGADPHASGPLHVIVVEAGGEQCGLVCDGLLGKKEIVIKPLGDVLEEVPCAAGATLLGDRCALILDVPALVRRAVERGSTPTAARGATLAAAPGGAKAAHILLVEDSETARESLRRLLIGAGYRCTVARDGAEALEYARAQSFDLVSTDIMMPRMDGYELTRSLRGMREYRSVPIVMVTSRAERIDRVRGFDAGVDEYITKPHDGHLYLHTIARLLRARPAGGGGESA
jgi:chemotaxis protein histidine kinase CheA/CheY-like chemotaxis protein